MTATNCKSLIPEQHASMHEHSLITEQLRELAYRRARKVIITSCKDGKRAKCPTCGHRLRLVNTHDKFCPACGQKLDWKE